MEDFLYFLDRIADDFYIKCSISGLGAFLIHMLGGFDAPLQFFLWILMLDFITGTSRAIYEGNLNSSTGREGVKKIFLYLIIISLAHSLETVGIVGMRAFALIIISLTEASSVIENVEDLGLDIPSISKKIDKEKNKRNKGG